MTIRPNRAKRKLQNGRITTVVGGLGFNTSDFIDFLGPLGYDAAWIEGEHGPMDFNLIPDATRACDLWGMTSVVRVSDNDYGLIYRVLDLGAQAITVPHVNTADEAQAIVEAAKFHPIGKRGMYPSRQSYGCADYNQQANDETMLIILIEDVKAVENLDEILKVDHIDVFFVAPSDLGQSMGHIDSPFHADVHKLERETLSRIVAAGRTQAP